MENRTLFQLLQLVRERFSKAAMVQGDSQARWLIAQLLRLPFHHPHLQPNHPVSDQEWQSVLEGAQRLMRGEPLEYICGYTLFAGLEFGVNAQVLIPRPETEEFVFCVLKKIKARGADLCATFRGLDLATGSGCLAIALTHHLRGLGSWQWHASDISEGALALAKANAQRLQVAIDFRQGSWLEPWQRLIGEGKGFDLVVCNPPYIAENERLSIAASTWEYEPHLALMGGEDGLDNYRLLAHQLAAFLNSGALVALEIGWRQGEALKKIFQEEGWGEGQVENDLSGHPRFFFIEKNR